jgi:hypothetical protein
VVDALVVLVLRGAGEVGPAPLGQQALQCGGVRVVNRPIADEDVAAGPAEEDRCLGFLWDLDFVLICVYLRLSAAGLRSSFAPSVRFYGYSVFGLSLWRAHPVAPESLFPP